MHEPSFALLETLGAQALTRLGADVQGLRLKAWVFGLFSQA